MVELTNCTHSICDECYDKWCKIQGGNATCPKCRAPVNVVVLTGTDAELSSDNGTGEESDEYEENSDDREFIVSDKDSYSQSEDTAYVPEKKKKKKKKRGQADKCKSNVVVRFVLYYYFPQQVAQLNPCVQDGLLTMWCCKENRYRHIHIHTYTHTYTHTHTHTQFLRRVRGGGRGNGFRNNQDNGEGELW